MDASSLDDNFGLHPGFCRAVRAEILAGRPLIAVHARDTFTPEKLLALVEDAATVAGRRSDLRILDLDVPRGSKVQFLHPQARSVKIPAKVPARRPDLLLACVRPVFNPPDSGTYRLDHHSVAPWRWQGAVDPRESNCLPVFAPSEFTGGAPLVVVLGETKAIPRTLAWLLEGAFLAGAAPLVASLNFPLRDVAAARQDHFRTGVQGHGRHGWGLMGAVRHVDLVDAGEEADSCEAAWCKASRGFHDAVRVQVTDGRATVEEGGRRVAVAGFQDADRYGIVVIGHREQPGAYVNLDECRSDGPATPEALAYLARKVWRGGKDAIAATAGTIAEGFGPLKSLTHGGVTEDSILDNLRAYEEGGYLGPDFAEALMTPGVRRLMECCAFAREPGRVFAWATQSGTPHRRRQFLEAMPAYAAGALVKEVSEAVDAGREIVPVLAAGMNLPAAMVRRVARRTVLPTPTFVWCVRAREDMFTWGNELFLALGYDHVPGAAEPDATWRAFLRCVELARFSLHGASMPPALVADLLKRIRGTWPERAAALGAVTFREMSRAGDMIRGLTELLACRLAREDLQSTSIAALHILADGRSLTGLYETLRRWERHSVLSEATGFYEPDPAWPVPFAVADLGDGWTATCLADVGSLADEGATGPDASGMEGLSHCAATYGPACSEGWAILVSLRHTEDGVTRRMSTVELTPDATRDPWNCPLRVGVKQHHGKQNALPSEQACAAVDRLRALVEEGSLPMPAQEPVRIQANEARRLVLADERLTLWAPILSRHWRGLDLAGIHARLIEKGLIPPDTDPAG